jgi:hypothetical protein
MKDILQKIEELELRVKELEDRQPRKKFLKPTHDEIGAYMLENGMSNQKIRDELVHKFWNFYESKGWKVGKNPMVNWKSSAANFMASNTNNSNGKVYTTNIGGKPIPTGTVAKGGFGQL